MGNRIYPTTDATLLPANIPGLVEQYQDILGTYPSIPGKEPIYPNLKLTSNMLSVLFPLKEHPIHGKTGLHAVERYKDGVVTRYSYQWKIIIPKLGKLSHHISAWGNDPHDAEWTNPEYRVESEPHHHHHIPGDWHQRQDNWDVWALEEAFAFVAYDIRTEKEYKA